MPTSSRSFYRLSRRSIARAMELLSLNQRRRFYALALAIGLLSGLAAVGFHQSIDAAERNLIGRMARVPGWAGIAGMILMPALGGLVVGFLVKHWAPEAAGSGIPQTKAAYYLKFGRIRLRTAVAKFVLGTISIGSGASLGREGPTVQICAAIASGVGRWFGLAPRQVMALVPLGCAGGIAAAFNTPMAAIMFAIEEIMGDLKRNALAGIVLVAVIAAVVERLLLGGASMFAVPDHPERLALLSLAWSAAIGIAAGLLSHAFVECLLRLRERAKAVRWRHSWAMPAVGGALTGCVGAAVFAGTGRMGVFGIGYADLSAALFGQLGVGLLLALFAGKFVATILSYSTGGAGGIFAPTLFIGAMLGGLVGSFADLLAPSATSHASVLALVGMGAMFAGVVRAPVTSILIIFELTRDYSLILPIMLANLTAYAIASRLREAPIYEALLLQDGTNLRKFPVLRPGVGWQGMPVSAIMTHTVRSLQADMRLADAYSQIKDESFKVYPALDASGRYVGLVHRKGVLAVAAKSPDKTVRDIFVSSSFPRLYPDMQIREVARRFVDTEWIALPVVSRLDPGRVVGIVTLHDITRQQFLQETRSD